jgi:hypothetical protein
MRGPPLGVRSSSAPGGLFGDGTSAKFRGRARTVEPGGVLILFDDQ